MQQQPENFMTEQSIKGLSNNELVKSLEGCFERERKTTHILLLHLKEIQARKLYADHGFPDLFRMLTSYFHQSETAANQRLYALRLMNDVPEIEGRIINGELNLSTLALAQRQIQREEKVTGIKIKADKKAEIVECISSKTLAQAEKELMTLLPESSKTLQTHERRISKDAVRLSLTIPDRVKEKMEELKNHWAAVNPKMDDLELIERSLDIALAKVDPLRKGKIKKAHASNLVVNKVKEIEKLCTTESVAQDGKNQQQNLMDQTFSSSAKLSKPLKRKTYYSIETDKIIWSRANSQCEFMDKATSRRCSSKFGLERDHIIPLAKGGSNEIDNLRLLCRTHNQLMARRHFGSDKIHREIQKISN